MARKSRVVITDDQIIDLIKQNPTMSNRAIAIELGMSVSGATNARIRELKENLSPEPVQDIQLYDTLARDGHWYRVTFMDPDSFVLKRTDGYGDPLTICMADYLAGKTGLKKRNLPPVITYIDPNLKKNKEDAAERKPAIINKDFDQVIDEMMVKNRSPENPSPATGQVLEVMVENIKQQTPNFKDVDYIDPDRGVEEKPVICAGCGAKLTPEEVYYYETCCEKCEQRAMAELEQMAVAELEVAPARRRYLDRINELLDIILPDCTDSMVEDTVGLAVGMLVKGIRDEAGYEY